MFHSPILMEITRSSWILFLTVYFIITILGLGGFIIYKILSFSAKNITFAELFRAFFKKKQKSNKLSKHKINDSEFSSTYLLDDMDIGVVIYEKRGHFIYANNTIYKQLSVESFPFLIDDFYKLYIEKNGMMRQLLLGKKVAKGEVTSANKVFQVKARVVSDDLFKQQIVFLFHDTTNEVLQEQKRKEFVANVSHELKTPLTTIMTYSEALIDWGIKEKSTNAIQLDVKKIHDDAKRMEQLVTDLLLLSSIDSHVLQMRMESLDLSSCVKQIVDRMQYQADEKMIKLSCVTVNIVPPIFGDFSSIDRIVGNLLSNALKYTDKGGEIYVYVGMIHDEAYVKVKDTGVGIPSEYINQIFDRFYRVDITGSRRYGGTGLGLSIVKELVDMHQGQIAVSSQYGRGTTFTVLFPLANSIYKRCIEQLKCNKQMTDSLLLAGVNDLVNIAKDAGLSVQTVADFTDKEIEIVEKILNQSTKQMEMITIETDMDET